ncbi:hypothetical protein TRM7557_02685 [Tritonibacter multivorans]|uniref:Uncharacterized protein n=1 Tax=Tritonibacter multivorans TaxID=928856 RepID=A0A0P1GE76_9RHOB|nr:hypothetical protein [Tritonibacter multivorans]MDA7420261.1 hypothetical protein [Tritonibacter multivorans]CUH79984.1 hypothetical protein TRM7557_02685 [Tritonibacter multivorans]SFB97944.1 hypothetical protein SAMN04488049_10133 [Tritonibacter multivorans]
MTGTTGSKALTPRGLTFRRLGLTVAAVMMPLVLACCMEGSQFAFAPDPSTANSGQRGGFFGRANPVVTTAFDEGQLVLAAPNGFCFDSQMEQHTSKGGFALLARCDRMRGARRLGRGEGVIVTASIGSVAANTATPSATALHKAFTRARSDARLLEQREDAQIPLVKLHMQPDDTTPGASPTHWRGAFVQNSHMVAVALYAPAGSSYLGDRGAKLIRDFMRASRSATELAQLSKPTVDPAGSSPRPRLRPQLQQSETTSASADDQNG